MAKYVNYDGLKHFKSKQDEANAAKFLGIHGKAETAAASDTATKLAAAVKINGIAFDGSADITIPTDSASPTIFFSDKDILSQTNVGLTDIDTNGVTPKVGDTIIDSKHDRYFITAVNPASGTEGQDGYVPATVTVGDAVGTNNIATKDDISSITASTIKYGDSTVAAILDDLTYVPVSINSFTNSVNTVEVGSTVTDVTFNWSLGGKPTEVKFNDTAQATDTTGTTSLTKQTIKTNTGFTLTAKDARNKSVSSQTWIVFKNKKYWGVGKPANADAVDSAFILGLGNSYFADNYRGDFSVNATDGNYIFFAVPKSFGDSPSFFVGGFEGGFALYKTFDFTNASGATVSYNVFKSTNPDLGQTTVTVK